MPTRQRDMDLIRTILLELEEKASGIGTVDITVTNYNDARVAERRYAIALGFNPRFGIHNNGPVAERRHAVEGSDNNPHQPRRAKSCHPRITAL